MLGKANMTRTKNNKVPNLIILCAFSLLTLSSFLPAIAQSESQTDLTQSLHSKSRPTKSQSPSYSNSPKDTTQTPSQSQTKKAQSSQKDSTQNPPQSQSKQAQTQSHPGQSNSEKRTSQSPSKSQSKTAQSRSSSRQSSRDTTHSPTQSQSNQVQSNSNSPSGQAQQTLSQTNQTATLSLTNQPQSQTQSKPQSGAAGTENSFAAAALVMPMYRKREPDGGESIIKPGPTRSQAEEHMIFFQDSSHGHGRHQSSPNETTLPSPPPPSPPPMQVPPPAPPAPPSPVSKHNGTQNRSELTRVFLEHHNKLRAELNQAPLIWDRKLTRYARRWAAKRAKKCEMVHSDGPYGENIFMGEPGRTWSAETAMKYWTDERAYYDAETKTCTAGQLCGHYTQMIWSRTQKLGCAWVECANKGVFVQCNYDPPGNYVGDNPFQ